MKRLALLLAIVTSQAFGQVASADSLKSALRTLTGRERLAALQALVNQIETKAPQEALKYAAEGIALAVQAGDQEAEAAFLSTTAFCYSLTGDFALALTFGQRTRVLAERLGNKDRMAKADGTLGSTYTFMGLYSKALEHHLESLRIREELHLETAALVSLNSIGTLYHHIGQYDRAIDYYQQMLRRMTQRPDTSRMVLLAQLNTAFAHYKRGRLREALAIDEGAVVRARRANNGTVAYAYFNLGIVHSDLRRYPEALKYLRLSLAEYQAQDQKHGRVQVLNALGRMYSESGALAAALPPLRESAVLSRQIYARDELKVSYELTAAVYERLGNVAEALRYYKLYTAAKDSIYNTQESDRLADVSMKFVTLQKDNEIESLKRERMISALELERKTLFQYILVVILASLAAIIATLHRSRKKLRLGQAQLEANNIELARLNDELNVRLHEIKTLSGLLPICAWCKNIRDDQGYWQQLEGYIGQRTAAQFSHGICPSCMEKQYPEEP